MTAMKSERPAESDLTLTIVLPVYREHGRLIGTLQRVTAFITAHDAVGVNVDAIFVDDGSPDNTGDIVNAYVADREDPKIKLIRYDVNMGKGFAVKTGILAATGSLILMSDADLSTPLEDWRTLYAALQAGADIACGSRAVQGAHIGKPAPGCRRMLSRLFNWLVRLAGVHGIRDTQCGFKLFKAGPAREIFQQMRTNRFAFDVEMIALARDLGYRVAEAPVNWDYSGHSTVRIFSSGGRMLYDVFLLAARRTLFGKRGKKPQGATGNV